MRRTAVITFILFISLLISCKNELISLNEELLDKAKDQTAPEIIIDSPAADSIFGQTVTVSGTVSDDGSILPVLEYQVFNDLGELKVGGSAELKALETGLGVSGRFDIVFSTEYMNSDILISLTATDWNGNVKTPSSFSLKYPGNAIPSLTAVSGSREINLSWDAISDVIEYRIYYTKGREIFTEYSASCEVLVPGNGERISVVLNSDDHGIGNNRLSQILVRAVTPDSTLDSSLIDIVPLSSLTLTPRVSAGTDSVFLNWNSVQSAEGIEVEYIVWRSESGVEGTYSRISPSGWNSGSFTDKSVREGQSYYYRVSLDGVSSVMSEAAVCKTPRTIPDLYDVSYRELLTNSEFDYGDRIFFTPDGTRLFMIDSSADVINELDMVSGDVIGTPYTSSVENTSLYTITGTNDTLFVLSSTATSYDPSNRQIISLDISTQGSITQLDRTEVPYAGLITLYGQTLYMSKSNESSHYSMDVSNPAVLPVESAISYGASVTVESGSVEDLFFAGDYMYSRCADASGTIQLAVYHPGTGIWTAKDFMADSSGITQDDLNRTYMVRNVDSGKLVIISDTGSSICDLLIWVYDIQSDGSLSLMDYQVLEDQEFLNLTVPLIINDTLYLSRYKKTVQAVSIGRRIFVKTGHTIPHYPYLLNPDGSKLFVYTYDEEAGIVSLVEESPLDYQSELSIGAGSSPIAFDGGRLFTYNYSGDINQYGCGPNETLSLLGTDRYSGWGIAVYGDILFLRTGQKRIELYKINSDGTLGQYLGEISTLREVHSLAFAGDYLVAGENYQVEVFDVSDITDIRSVSEFEAPYMVKSSIVYEDSLLLIGNGTGLSCYDFSSPELPVLEGSFYDRSSSSHTFNSLDVQDGVVYLGSDTGLFALSLDQASYWSAAETASGNTGSAGSWIEGDAKSVKAAGEYLFFSNSGYLGVYSIADPKKPVLIYEDPERRYIESLALWGNGLYGKTTALLYSYFLDG